MKKIILGIIAIFIIITFLVVDNSKVINKEDNNKIKVNNNLLSMMLETKVGSGKYEMTTSSSWPTDGYVFNNELSKCENGGKLSWDDTNKKVVMEGNVSDKCYVYFDIYVPSISLTEYVISLYTGVQGTNDLYYHNSALTNGAEDNSYRFAGANPNNYICFGSEATTCPDDNLYRIIGVFGENNHGVTGKQLIKIIKNSSYGNYAWDTSASNDWTNSSLKDALNSTFITSKLSGYTDKIETVKWSLGGYADSRATAKDFYDAEVTNSTKIYEGKMGLIYSSDYGFAAPSSFWKTNMYSYNSSAYKSDWLYLSSANQWTITINPSIGDSDYAYYIDTSGYNYNQTVGNVYAVRPAMFLSTTTMYKSGLGTSSDPIRVK